jgi:hypothetical protein
MKRRPSIKDRVRAVILFASVIVLLVTTATFALTNSSALERNCPRPDHAGGHRRQQCRSAGLRHQADCEEILSALKANPDIVAAALYDVDETSATFPRGFRPICSRRVWRRRGMNSKTAP